MKIIHDAFLQNYYIHWLLIFFPILMYFVTFNEEASRQKENQNGYFVYDDQIPISISEKRSQIIANFSLLTSIFLIKLVVLSSAEDVEQMKTNYALYVISLNLFIALSMSLLSRTPEKIKKIQGEITPSISTPKIGN